MHPTSVAAEYSLEIIFGPSPDYTFSPCMSIFGILDQIDSALAKKQVGKLNSEPLRL